MATDHEAVESRTTGIGANEPESPSQAPGIVPRSDPAAIEARELEETTEPDEEADAVPAARDPAWGAWVVIIGLGAVVAALGLTLAFFNEDAQDVLAITGPAFAVITGLVAAYFGIRAGSLASDRVQGTAAGEPPPAMSGKRQRSSSRRTSGPAGGGAGGEPAGTRKPPRSRGLSLAGL